MKKLRIFIADDHAVVRRGLRAIIRSHAGWEVCGEASNGREAVSEVKKLKPDIAILDITMPELDGLEAATRIRKACPRMKVLILTSYRSKGLVRAIRAVGAKGYIVKTDSERCVLAALEALASNELFFSSIPLEENLPSSRICCLGQRRPGDE